MREVIPSGKGSAVMVVVPVPIPELGVSVSHGSGLVADQLMMLSLGLSVRAACELGALVSIISVLDSSSFPVSCVRFTVKLEVPLPATVSCALRAELVSLVCVAVTVIVLFPVPEVASSEYQSPVPVILQLVLEEIGNEVELPASRPILLLDM